MDCGLVDCRLSTFPVNATLLHAFHFYLCRVRVIIILYALYIAYLACYPCTDSETCADEIKASIAVVDTGNHEHSDAEQDLCSPFCICSCCRAQIQQPSYLFFDFHAVRITELRYGFNTPDIKTFPVPIWQPPKIV